MKNGMSSKNHAIVIGGSMAGLTAARVLTDYYERVTVFDRDYLPESADARKGVPQGRHPHALLKRGETNLEKLFPGIVADLKSQGAISVNMGSGTLWNAFGMWRPKYQSNLDALNCSRPLLEGTVRRHLAANPKIQFVNESEVIGLETNTEGTHISGIRVRSRNGMQIESETLLTADMVVDASGRDSRAPQWLATLGYAAPQETVVPCGAGYATRVYKIPADFAEDWKMFYMQPAAPAMKRGAIILPLEGDRWHATLIGMAGDYPPTSEEGYLEFARSLSDTKFYDIIKDAEPLGPVSGFRRDDNRMRHYHEMPKYLENFVLLGDAVFALNPVYGQGMSVATMGSMELQQALQDYQEGEFEANTFAEYFQKRLYQAVLFPWQLATGEDKRWYPSEEEEVFDPEAKLLGQYMEQVMRATCTNPNVLEVFYQVANLMDAPNIFFRPDIVLQVVNEMVAV